MKWRTILALLLLALLVCPWLSLNPSLLTSQSQLEASGSTTIFEVNSTIQQAIDQAEEGDTILVPPGRYSECLTIDKPLKLVGNGGSTIIQNPEHPSKCPTIEVSPGISGVTISGLYINGSGHSTGIYVLRCLANVIIDNVIANHHIGLHLYDSSQIVLRNNSMVENDYNLRVWGLFRSHFVHDISTSNEVDGKPVYYWIDQHDRIVPSDAGYVALVDSSRIIVRDLDLSSSLSGVLLAYTNETILFNVAASGNERGLYMVYSHRNYILNCSFFGNGWSGVSTVSSTNNYIVGNMLDNNKFGIRLSHSFPLLPCYSDNNTILGNLVSDCMDGIYLEASNQNQIRGNVIEDSHRYGLVLDESNGNRFEGNNVMDNEYGVWIYNPKTTNNTLNDNRFVNNTFQVDIESFFPAINFWDDGYPSGGNYWSDYASVDEKGGVYQNETGSDGIGDAPYVIDEYNQDKYPLFNPPIENARPEAEVTFRPENPKIGETVYFEDESADHDGEIILHFWIFDDQPVYMDTSISKTFEDEGNYTVQLDVYDDYGAGGSDSRVISVRRFFSFLTLSAPDSATVGKEIEISARLLDEEGWGLANSSLYFYLVDRDSAEWIGSSLTNSSGITTVLYTPVEVGDFEVKTAYNGSNLYTHSTLTKPLTVKGEHPDFALILTILFALSIVVIVVRTIFRRSKGDEA